MPWFDSVEPLLEGIRVLSVGTFVAGNLCPLLIVGLGADVVKVESRTHPESLRSYDGPETELVFEPSGVRTTALFAGITRGMRSVALELDDPCGQETFRSLAEQADVVIENLAPLTLDRWGCGFDVLVRSNPQLVMLSISGYGRTGPLAHYRAYASNIHNYLGLTAAWVLDGTHFDFVAALHGVNAVVAALAHVRRGGPGILVDLAQTEAGAAVMGSLYLDPLANGREAIQGPNEVPGSRWSGVVRCAGADAWMAVELEDEADWRVACRYLERPDLALEDGPPADRGAALAEALASWASTLTPFQAALRLQRRGLAAGPVQDSEDLWRDPQLRSRQGFAEVVHPDLGTLEYPEVGFRPFAAGSGNRRGPRLGEHTRQVLAEWVEMAPGRVDELERTGAVWQAEPA